jgi:glutamine synthetase
MSGTARGKILPASKFVKGARTQGLRIPEDIFILTVTGRYSLKTDATDQASIDIYMRPDYDTMRIVPWYENPTAEVICDCFYVDDRPVDIAPRYVLQRVIDLYHQNGWRPVVAPELEFYLVKKNLDPDYPLEAPIGRSGRAEKMGQAYGIDAANNFDAVVDDVYDYCEQQQIDIDTISHESGPAQLEINFNHGDPVALADQVFLFKRTVRMAALKHDVYATFMAKPHAEEPGSSMHIHQSVVDLKTGKPLFGGPGGKPSKLLLNHIAGLQRYMAAALPFFAPNVNSYRRLVPGSDAPTNTHWGIDNRTAPLRVPASDAANLRVENRVPEPTPIPIWRLPPRWPAAGSA